MEEDVLCNYIGRLVKVEGTEINTYYGKMWGYSNELITLNPFLTKRRLVEIPTYIELDDLKRTDPSKERFISINRDKISTIEALVVE